MSYIEFPSNLDYNTMVASAFAYLTEAYPGWVPHESNLDVQLIEVACRLMVETGTVTSLVAPGIFRWFGRNLINIQPIDAVPATVPSTWTLSDNAGHTIKRGTAVSLQKSGDENLFFTVQTDVVVAPGSTATSAGEVTLVAVDSGINGNGIAPATVTLIESLAWVDSVVTTATTSGGVDPEVDDAYLSRLSRDLELLSPEPILPVDYEVMAANVGGVGRAHAVDNYNPVDNTYGNERMVAVALVDTDGTTVATPIKTAVKTYLESFRETNFVVNVMDASYQTIDVTVAVHKTSTADATDVHDACIVALQTYLNPVNWTWSGTVRVNEIISLLDRVDGVDYVTTPTVPGTDVTLTGPAPLPQSGSLDVVVSG